MRKDTPEESWEHKIIQRFIDYLEKEAERYREQVKDLQYNMSLSEREALQPVMGSERMEKVARGIMLPSQRRSKLEKLHRKLVSVQAPVAEVKGSEGDPL